jgi:hypothetical protein
LPAELQARLAAPLAEVNRAISLYLRSAAGALRLGAGAPAIRPVHLALQHYASEIASLRGEGLTRDLPGDAAERFFAIGFSLEQMRQNLLDLDRVIGEWSDSKISLPPAGPTG